MDGAPSTLILGDNIFYSNELEQILAEADNRSSGATIFGYHVSDPTSYGVVEFDGMGKAISLEEKPAMSQNQIMQYLDYIFMMNRQVAAQRL